MQIVLVVFLNADALSRLACSLCLLSPSFARFASCCRESHPPLCPSYSVANAAASLIPLCASHRFAVPTALSYSVVAFATSFTVIGIVFICLTFVRRHPALTRPFSCRPSRTLLLSFPRPCLRWLPAGLPRLALEHLLPAIRYCVAHSVSDQPSRTAAEPVSLADLRSSFVCMTSKA